MKTQMKLDMWRFGLMFILLCICSIPSLAGAGVAPPVPTGPLDAVGGTPDYYTTANWANSPPMSKFVDTLPGLGSAKANNLGQYLPVAVPDTTSYPGSDYYIIELREYSEKMHSDLNPTKLRGYVQVDAAGNDVAPIHYLGPVIVAERDRPVRIKFTNKLPVGPLGDLFIPVDTTVMGAGKGPATLGAGRGQGGACDNTVEPNGCASYPQNRAAIHLHGGRTPWISDGTPHQWITPVGEITPFTKGVSLQNVPDMPDPGDGSTTYYYSNQQSARLMFYHDHAFGITRLNVYAGEAAGYVITDQYEQDLVNRGLIPSDQIPLIIQDKTFVDATPTTKYIYNPATGKFDNPITVPKVRETDPLWNWGSLPPVSGVVPPVTGDLWLPHVYMPAQNPLAGSGGVNPFGRWMYGPWFYPATNVVHGPVANPYYDADCSSPIPAVYAQCSTPGQPPQIPGTPNVSMGMEAFQDSAVVNGTAFPTLTVDPRAYRFRILNAASDRFQNLSFYVADPNQLSTDPRVRSAMTEVKMVTASTELALANNWPADWPVDGRDGGVPDPGICAPGGVNCPNLGPSFLQIGTEGGFLPQPVVRGPQPVTYITDPTAFWVGIVDKTGLALGPAERADVIVDFSAYAGKTLILYNDAPAAWPARVPGYDYYTGAPDMRDSGGYGTGGTWDSITGTWIGGTGPLVGKAPNTRTVMQIIVTGGTSGLASVDAPYTFDPAALAAEFTSAATPTALNPAPVKTLFERSQDPIIVGQAAYSTTYPNSYFPPNFPWEGVNQINDQFLNFVTVTGEPVQMATEPKGIHDEMGASFDPEYGRMSGNLAMQLPNPTTLNANLILYGFSDIPTETVNNSPTVNVQVIPGLPGTVTDGTQIWKISHNGVDTHPIHFHIFDVQLVNRVGWDGQIAMPEANELGWKDTVKISPLMDTIVAVRPRAPLLPFGITNSLRQLNPAIPVDSGMGFTINDATPGSNWFLGTSFLPPNRSLYGFSSIDWLTGQAYPAINANPGFPYDNFKGIVTNVLYDFGWEYVWHCHILSHEEMDMMRPIVLYVPSTIPDAPTGLAATPGGLLTWTDPTPATLVNNLPANLGNAKNEIGFRIQRCNGTCTPADPFIGSALANATSYLDTTAAASSSYSYRIYAYNAAGNSPTSGIVTVNMAASLLPPTVAITAPANGANFSFGAPVPIAATATADTGFTIAKVEFFDNGVLLSTDTAAPYAYNWTNATAGTHILTAVATDSNNRATTSAAVTITVAQPIPTVTLSSSLASPRTEGIDVIFTALAAGAPYYEYRFLLNNVQVQPPIGGASNFSTTNSWTMPASTRAGTYNVTVEVRTLTTGPATASASVSYTLTVAGACTTPGIVTIADLQAAINMFLGLTPALPCANSSGTGTVSIADIQRAINNFLGL